MGFPGGGEAFHGEFERVELLGEGEPDVVVVAPVDAGGTARSDGDAVAGGDMSEGIGAVGGELDPQRQPGRGGLGSPGGEKGGEGGRGGGEMGEVT